MQLMTDYVKSVGGGLSPWEIATPVQSERAEEVAKSFERLSAAFTAVKEGILLKILNVLEPLSNWLRSVLKSVLTVLNNNGPWKGQFTETLASMHADDAAVNAQKHDVNGYQMQAVEIQLGKMRQDYGFTDAAKRAQAVQNFEKGILPENMTWDTARNYFGAEHLYAYTQAKNTELQSLDAVSGKKQVSNTSPTAYGSEAYAYLSRAGHAYSTGVEKVIEKYSADKNKGLWSSLHGALSEVEKDTQKYRNPTTAEEALRYPKIGGGFKDPITGENYRTYEQHMAGREAYLQMIRQAIALIPQILQGDARYVPGEVQLPVAVGARKEAEEVTVSAQVIDAIRSSVVGNDFLRMLESGAVRVVGELKAEKREYTFKLVDENDKLIKTFPDIYNPTAQSMLLTDNDNLNWRNTRDAPAPAGEEAAMTGGPISILAAIFLSAAGAEAAVSAAGPAQVLAGAAAACRRYRLYALCVEKDERYQARYTPQKADKIKPVQNGHYPAGVPPFIRTQGFPVIAALDIVGNSVVIPPVNDGTYQVYGCVNDQCHGEARPGCYENGFICCPLERYDVINKSERYAEGTSREQGGIFVELFILVQLYLAAALQVPGKQAVYFFLPGIFGLLVFGFFLLVLFQELLVYGLPLFFGFRPGIRVCIGHYTPPAVQYIPQDRFRQEGGMPCRAGL
jgi:hypothetical protein